MKLALGNQYLIDAINVVLGNKKTNKIMRNENLDTEIVCQFHITNKNVLDLLEDKDLIRQVKIVYLEEILTLKILLKFTLMISQ